MKESIQETIPTTRPGATPNGHGVRPEGMTRPQGTLPAQPEQAKSNGRSRTRFIVLPILLIVLGVGGYFGYQYWLNQQLYVSTDNAQIAGTLIQVGAVNAGRLENVQVDIGDSVQKDQVVGNVLLPSTVGMSQSGTPLLGFVGTENQRTDIKSPITGVVVARSGNPGDTIAAGQSVLTVVDPTKLWVQAQIDETKVGRVQVGQPVDVTVDSLGTTLQGKVIAVNRASSSTFSLLPSTNASGDFTKVTQWVPVKISIDYGNLPLVMGSSVEVRIRVQN
jgi:multidrug resistance efflux pump